MTTTTTERLTLRTSTVRPVADDIIEITYTHPDSASLPAWEPGAHIELSLPSGLSRQYSLCGDPADRSSYTIAVLREENGRGGSREVHALAREGAEFDIRVPKNNFPFVEAESYLFIGGGIGITPLIPMIDAARARGATWQLVYGGRSATSMAYRETLAAHGAQVDVWVEAERGYPDLPRILGGATPGTQVYVCGPNAMIDAVAAEYPGHPQLGGLHFERFGATGPIDTGGDAFEVELRQTGVTFTVGEGCTILAEVQKVLPDHPSSCEEGYCGECETRVLEGTPDHRDDYLTADEQDNGDMMMICVSRCKSARLVLDL
ncbi:PDR/VanB family oxidoreductase [Nocardia carnea]|uniref:PDR/VanB family oxidoreductase n=1 Tax=Nocardia carnea TaxID=37328 RepID=UPI002453B08D|nr:PDR/VanB family oxidoreductase [Nocardia carnea]